MVKTVSLRNQKGFTLIEVMIALTVFSVFIAAYVTTQGYNIADSIQMKEEVILKELCENIINDIVVNPPEFREALTLAPDVKTIEDNEMFERSITYKRFKIPDLSKITGKSGGDEEGGEEAPGQGGIEGMIFKQIQENMEEVLWQVEVKVTNKETGFHYALTTWLLNDKAEVNFAF